MSKFMKRLTALLLLMALIAIFPATTYATTGCPQEEGEVLGTPDDISGYILPDEESTSGFASGDLAGTDMVVIPDVGEGSKWTTIFSIRAGEVRDLLVSGEGKKTFRRCDLPYEAKEFLITGRLYHTAEKCPTGQGPIRCGICYYDLWKNVYVRVYSVYSHNNEFIWETVSVDTVMERVPDCCGHDRKTEILHTFVKNYAGYGYVYGDMSLYYTCE